MYEPLVEIILVNYNSASDTAECIESLEKITYHNKHIVVVDNGSIDSSILKLTNLKKKINFEIISLNVNAGFSAGNNIGIQYAVQKKADYVLLLNNDTLVTPEFLTKLIKFHESVKQCDVSIGKIYYASEPQKIWYAGGSINFVTGHITHERYGKTDSTNIEDIPRKVTFATGCCMCMKMSTIKDVGLMDEDYFLYEEDSDYCCRLAKLGKHIYYIPTSVIYHKVSASTGKTPPLTQYYTARNHFMLIRKNFNGWKKIIALIYTFLLLSRRCLCNEICIRHTVRGIIAFFKGETGKNASVQNSSRLTH